MLGFINAYIYLSNNRYYDFGRSSIEGTKKKYRKFRQGWKGIEFFTLFSNSNVVSL